MTIVTKLKREQFKLLQYSTYSKYKNVLSTTIFSHNAL